MARVKTVANESLLAAALEGLELQKSRVEEQIRHVRALLGRRGPKTTVETPAVAAAPAPKKRELSEAARRRIAAAQKRRWAEYRKQAAQAKES